MGNGIQKFSCHFEADLEKSGRSVLAIRPLRWKDGWPVAGENIKEGVYKIESERSGYVLELCVDFVRMPRTMGFSQRETNEPVKPVPGQQLADVIKDWPSGDIAVRMGDNMVRPHQKWTITPVDSVGGYLGSPYFKITITSTNRTLTATAEREVVTVPEFTGKPEQLWRIDQLIDGTYRIMPKEVPNCKEPLALIAIGARSLTLATFDPNSDNSRWNLKMQSK